MHENKDNWLRGPSKFVRVDVPLTDLDWYSYKISSLSLKPCVAVQKWTNDEDEDGSDSDSDTVTVRWQINHYCMSHSAMHQMSQKLEVTGI